MAAPNDEDYALQLHKQLNAIPLRTRRGQELGTQQSFDRSKQRDKAGKPRTKRTNSSSQEHPSSRKRRASDADDEHGHTSAHHRAVKREASESDHSHPSDDEQAGGRPKQQHERRIKPCDSRDSGARHGQQQQLELAEQGALQLAHCTPSQSAAAVAAAATKRLVKEQQAHSSHVGPPQQAVKVFYAGVRWGLSLQPSAVKSRALLAKALNDAFVGEILSVGQGECLTVVFLDASGSVAELGPTKWSAAKSASARWRALAKTAARIYVRGEEGHVPGT